MIVLPDDLPIFISQWYLQTKRFTLQQLYVINDRIYKSKKRSVIRNHSVYSFWFVRYFFYLFGVVFFIVTGEGQLTESTTSCSCSFLSAQLSSCLHHVLLFSWPDVLTDAREVPSRFHHEEWPLHSVLQPEEQTISLFLMVLHINLCPACSRI